MIVEAFATRDERAHHRPNDRTPKHAPPPPPSPSPPPPAPEAVGKRKERSNGPAPFDAKRPCESDISWLKCLADIAKNINSRTRRMEGVHAAVRCSDLRGIIQGYLHIFPGSFIALKLSRKLVYVSNTMRYTSNWRTNADDAMNLHNFVIAFVSYYHREARGHFRDFRSDAELGDEGYAKRKIGILGDLAMCSPSHVIRDELRVYEDMEFRAASIMQAALRVEDTDAMDVASVIWMSFKTMKANLMSAPRPRNGHVYKSRDEHIMVLDDDYNRCYTIPELLQLSECRAIVEECSPRSATTQTRAFPGPWTPSC